MHPIPLSHIHPRADAREVDGAVVSRLVESMAEIGLVNPIRVRKRDTGFELCAGHHRWKAAQELGWSEIPAIVEECSDLDAELVMIDENLCRAELSAADRAHYTARRKAIYEAKHPETKHGGDRKSDQVANFATRSFASETATKTGESERVVRLHAERGEKVAPEVLRRVRGTHLDNGVYLDELKKLPAEEQGAKVERDLASQARREKRRKPTRVSDPPLNEEEACERQVAALMSAWNKAGQQAREQFLARIDRPIMDARHGAAA